MKKTENNGNHRDTRQERRSKRKANRRKMAVHGRTLKKQPKKRDT